MEANTNFEETTYQNVKIPAGMAVSQVDGENTLEKGLVVIDKNGNEWVWIEVPKSIYNNTEYNGGTAPSFEKPSTEEDYQKIKEVLIAYIGVYRGGQVWQGYNWTDEWYAMDGETLVTASRTGLTDTQKTLNNGCGLTYNEYQITYQKMLSSVYVNGGFWIGRYEAGVSNTTPRTASGEITGLKAKSQKDMYPFNYVTCSQAQTLASAMSTDSSKTSSLMFGIQWDLVCKFLEGKDGLTTEQINSNSGTWGNYFDVEVPITSANAKQKEDDGTWSYITGTKEKNRAILLSTGASTNTSKMNIYDFAGNTWEWTLEKASNLDDPCAFRGGGCAGGTDYSASYRYNTGSSYSISRISFRPSLY